jgi:hypothetical protein
VTKEADYIRLLRADRAYLRRTLSKVYRRVNTARFAKFSGPDLWDALDITKEALEWTRVVRTKSGNKYPVRK